MAKNKITSLGIFAKTDKPAATATAQPAKDDIIESKGVGLKLSEWGEIETLAAELGMTRHGLAASLLRYGLKEYKAGKIKTKTQKTLDL